MYLCPKEGVKLLKNYGHRKTLLFVEVEQHLDEDAVCRNEVSDIKSLITIIIINKTIELMEVYGVPTK